MGVGEAFGLGIGVGVGTATFLTAARTPVGAVSNKAERPKVAANFLIGVIMWWEPEACQEEIEHAKLLVSLYQLTYVETFTKG